jgi:transposase
LWQTNAENLSHAQRNPLEQLTARFPKWKALIEQRERLRAAFEDRSIRAAASGQKRLREWMEQAQASGLKALVQFCKTLENWLGKIANSFVWRSSNGRTEGYTLGLRAVLWRAFGMRNVQHFRLRILDRFGTARKS